MNGGPGQTLDLSGAHPVSAGPAPNNFYNVPETGGQTTPPTVLPDGLQRQVNDPVFQQQVIENVKVVAQHGLVHAQKAAGQGAVELNKYIQEGPRGVSVLCFCGGLATFAVGLLGMLNVFSTLLDPLHYLLNGYLTLFGITAAVLEFDLEQLRTLPMLGRLWPYVAAYQRWVFEEARFLTELKGRGFFYLFVGTLALTQCLFCLLFLCGLWNMLMGVLCIMMGFGHKPPELSVPNGLGGKGPLLDEYDSVNQALNRHSIP